MHQNKPKQHTVPVRGSQEYAMWSKHLYHPLGRAQCPGVVEK